MSSRSRWKLLTALVLGFAALGVIGWQRIPPGPVTPATITLTPTVTRVSASQTTVVPSRPTEWIRITQVKPVDYYLSLLYSNGTSPYGRLYWELRKLPDMTNATAVAKITYLALNATNPEVKEAFELILKGGTPNPGDYAYKVPEYNTELQVLYWLACQSEFKKDDTLALSIAMVHGLWVTMGDEQVRQAVRKDTNDLLGFFRETNEIQKAKRHSQLEAYPLEAKLALAWTGTRTSLQGPFGLIRYSNYHLATPTYRQSWPATRLPLEAYEWSRMSVTTLKEIQDYTSGKSVLNDSDKYISQWEDYFFGEFMGTGINHWSFVTYPDVIENVEGVDVRDGQVLNIRYQMQRILSGKNPIGDCGAETALMDAFAKAVGLASLNTWRVTLDRGYKASDGALLYYNPQSRVWKIYSARIGQTMLGKGDILPSDRLDFWVYNPPVILPYFLNATANTPTGPSYSGGMFFALRNVRKGDLNRMLMEGIVSSQMKQWLLYS